MTTNILWVDMTAKRKSATRNLGQVPGPDPIAYPESEFSRFQRAKLIEVDLAQAEHEQKWGIGRVITLVPTDFRVKFYAQAERIWAAQKSQDVSRMASACDGMIRAFKSMSNWAMAEGIEPLSQVKAIEADTHLGIMAIVKDEQDANQYLAIRKDVVQVWTVSEIAELLKAGIGQAMADLKAKLPVRGFVAAVQQDSAAHSAAHSADSAKGFCNSAGEGKKAGGEAAGLGGASGFEDMENDLDLVTPVNVPKMFSAPHGEMKG